MHGKTLLFAGLIAFLIFGFSKVFQTDTSNPETVLKNYLSNWKKENGASMYPLISTRAKGELTRQKIINVVDYYADFATNRADLIEWQLQSRFIGQNASRFRVSLRFRNLIGKENVEPTTFYLVLEENGWRVDGWQNSNIYALP